MTAVPADSQHVCVVTRLNIYVFKKRTLQDRGWLARRLDLFERWTVPSMRWQTAPADSWIILVDETTHPDDLARVRRATQGLPTRLVTLPSVYEMPTYYERVGPALATDRPWVVTCRLDSDDSLARTYLASVREHVGETTGEFLNCRNGFKLAGHRLARIADDSSPFLAFVEPAGRQVRSVYHVAHQVASTSAPVRQIPRGPAWLTRVHDLNMVSTMSGERVPLAAMHEEFPYSRAGIMAEAAIAAVRRRTVGRREIRAIRKRRAESGELW